MSNRFKHIKDKHKDIDSFIEGANHSVENEPEQKDMRKVLLRVSSRMNRDEECKKPVLLHIRRDVASDLDKYCHGNMQAILNYLLRRGLDSLVEDNELILM